MKITTINDYLNDNNRNQTEIKSTTKILDLFRIFGDFRYKN